MNFDQLMKTEALKSVVDNNDIINQIFNRIKYDKVHSV
jgi:hypothetical protein